jgi:(S)-2-hydroxyglutarate dehydrogenase
MSYLRLQLKEKMMYSRFLIWFHIIKNDYSLHVLNYNSPGATGALPMAAMIANELVEEGILLSASANSSTTNSTESNKNPIWDIAAISENVRDLKQL